MSDESTHVLHCSGQFGADDLRVVGGDYGQIHLEAVSEANRVFIDAFIDAARRGGCGAVVVSLVLEYDSQAPVFEERHAGLEGTTRIETPALDGPEDPQGAAPSGAG